MAYAAVWKHHTYTVAPYKEGVGYDNTPIPCPSFELIAIAGTKRELRARVYEWRRAVGEERPIAVTLKIVRVTTLPLLGIQAGAVTAYYKRVMGLGPKRRTNRKRRTR